MTLTDSERIANLEDAVTRIEATLGDWTKPPQLSLGETPTALPNGRYNLKESDYQLHVALDKLYDAGGIIEQLKARILALESRPSGSVVTAPSSSPIPLAAGDAVAVREMRKLTGASRVYHKGEFECADVEVHTRPQSFMGPVAVGGTPIAGAASLQVMSGGEILFVTQVASADTQEKNGDKLRSGALSFNPYDNGVRLIRGGFWRGPLLNRTENVVQILGMDSAGTVSKSHEDYSQEYGERGQLWIIREDFDSKKIIVTACRAGWGVEVDASTQTYNDHNPNPGDRKVALIEPLKQSRDIIAP